MVVYFHRNPKTLQVFYVGIGTSEKRAYSFYENARSTVWHRYVSKYGKPVVDIVLQGLTKEQAIREEIYFICHFGRINNGGILYNLNDGGDTGSNLAEWVSLNPDKNPMFNPEIANRFKGENNNAKRPEAREKLRVANLGKRATKETKLKQSLLKLGKPSTQPKGYKHSEETIQKLSIINKEIANRPEVKDKIRLARLGQRNTSLFKMVCKLNPSTNEVIKTYDCIMDALMEFGKPRSGNITSVCVGRRNFAFGYKWKYAS